MTYTRRAAFLALSLLAILAATPNAAAYSVVTNVSVIDCHETEAGYVCYLCGPEYNDDPMPAIYPDGERLGFRVTAVKPGSHGEAPTLAGADYYACA